MSICCLLGWASGCARQAATKNNTGAAVPATVPVVRATTATLHPWPRVVRIQGSLIGDEEALIGAKVAGRVKAVRVDRGSAVKDGDVLVELEPEEFTLRVRHAEAQVEQVRAKLGLRPGEPEAKLDRLKSPPVVEAQAILAEERLKADRVRHLIRQSATAAEDVQRQDAALRVAEARTASALNTVEEQIALLSVRNAELALARQQHADATIKAPFRGIVQERRVAPGVYVQVGDPIVTLVRTDPLRFQAGVPEREAGQVRVQEEIHIFLEGESEPLSARVTRISPALERASRSLLIEADLPNPAGRLRAGLFAWADIVVTADARCLAVPESSVVEFAGVEKVWLLRGQQAEERRIVTGRRANGMVEVLQGLSAGLEVVADGRQGRTGTVVVSTGETTPATVAQDNGGAGPARDKPSAAQTHPQVGGGS